MIINDEYTIYKLATNYRSSFLSTKQKNKLRIKQIIISYLTFCKRVIWGKLYVNTFAHVLISISLESTYTSLCPLIINPHFTKHIIII